ncbi:Cell fate regulator YlbF, YheA/YmcA/DUF963 family (controls sporulation, competence, biofilm development) [Alkalispirochaeta americana]|uniref:Cell fate regulator YlbF, YheA/YmcA/DUF963 family (Controls sporulation, competence, biofilm development) n=1 Tax=Alkalispirochaeta americana TaxID=159291 RepID=A0A1N6SIQ4_9SPIO|nr:YlbF family regulator [Alkalispirochaeta americana]SIQ40939.1 Cell fate regulator YlbF, YheA/YmcA/DUF963 family (controls sporulation, competence, biofilm development) [Alkalispirochaeta americana]
MTNALKQATDTFIAALEKAPPVHTFQEANRLFESSEELQGLREQYSALAHELQQKQMEGTLTQENITELRAIQNQVNTHKITANLLSTRNEAVTTLGLANRTISEIVGFDYAATAAPARTC